MQNSPELNGKYLGTITKDFAQVSDTLKEASYQLRRRKISDFPIFPISKDEVNVGQLLLGKTEVNSAWNYNFSYLDEFVQRELIKGDMVEEFKKTFKDPDEFCCLFVIDKEFLNFVFIPFPED